MKKLEVLSSPAEQEFSLEHDQLTMFRNNNALLEGVIDTSTMLFTVPVNMFNLPVYYYGAFSSLLLVCMWSISIILDVKYKRSNAIQYLVLCSGKLFKKYSRCFL